VAPSCNRVAGLPPATRGKNQPHQHRCLSRMDRELPRARTRACTLSLIASFSRTFFADSAATHTGELAWGYRKAPTCCVRLLFSASSVLDMPLFDFYVMVDWSGGARTPATIGVPRSESFMLALYSTPEPRHRDSDPAGRTSPVSNRRTVRYRPSQPDAHDGTERVQVRYFPVCSRRQRSCDLAPNI
jgi:hypothetical protein